MNSIIMVTIVAGNIISKAVFPDMDTCMVSRDKVVEQPSVTVSCVYSTKKKDNSKHMLTIMSGFLKAINNAAKEEAAK
jgi:hypothetical protein|tara:strand:+ start:445 stop:678 length:234 start_codon:yes stop_codon:yes gene_type:complete